MSVDPARTLNLFWTNGIRIEPSSRFSWTLNSKQAALALGAELHDPLWTLYRQWQVGEFKGEDAGTPASVSVSTQTLPLNRWWPGTEVRGSGHALIPSRNPAEATVTGEPFPLDARMRVELGRLLLASIEDAAVAASLSQAALTKLVDDARSSLIQRAPLPADAELPAAARLLRLARATVPDGGALFTRTTLPTDLAPLGPSLDWTSVVSQWRVTAARTLGLDAGDRAAPGDEALPSASRSWDVSRLDHRAVLANADTKDARVLLRVDPDADGTLDWFAFDLVSNPALAWSVVKPKTHVGIPGRITMPGMPSARWWDFEDSAHSLTAMDLDVGESEEDVKNHQAAKLAWLDFQLVHGLDWFMLAVPAPVGSLCRVHSLTVRDVFGLPHVVKPAEPGSGERRWSMFRNANSERNLLVVAPTTAPHHEIGAPLEQLRFARDEQANLVWAIPLVAPDGLGRGRRVDRQVVEQPDEKGVFRSHQNPPRLRYVPQSQVPRNWIPFLPMQIRPGSEAIRLQRGAVAGADGRRHTAKPSPILATPPGEPLYLREESVPRGGVRVTRRPMRARDAWGRVWVWVQRGAEVGSGEVSSGLRFDLALDDSASEG